MNYYIISYDVINADYDRNGDVLDSLIDIVSSSALITSYDII